MAETLADERQRLKDAYEFGYEEFADSDIPKDHTDFAGYTSTARYANIVMPKLRRIAGFNDPMDTGTYQDAPSNAHRDFLEEIVETFYDGAHDAIQGQDKDHTQHIGSDL